MRHSKSKNPTPEGFGLSYNFRTCEKDYALLAGVMAGIDETASSDVSGEGFLKKILDLIKDLGFPSRPSEVGLRKDDADKLLKNTLVQTRRIKTNPRPLDGDLLSQIEEGI